MDLWQALLIGLFAYLGSKRTPWVFGITGGWQVIGKPLIAGLIVGIILGDVKSGILAGVAVQAMYIGMITPGGAMPADVIFAGYIGIPLALASGGGADYAVALAVPLSLVGIGVFNFLMSINSIFPHKADKYAEIGDEKGIIRMNILGTVPTFVLRFGIVFAVCYFGAPAAEAIINALPESVLHFFKIAGRMLPAVGFALLLKQSVNKTWMIVFFLLGYVMMISTPITITSLAIFAAAIAMIFVMNSGSNSNVAVSNSGEIMEEDDCYED
ncbi:MAG: PTS sugar transporter subunit IIC [Vallitalea sp.]|jgi:PTS system mannose-specific IIC component|nr:PTS sugar transporter subunit IIC [Vallitalea sp.]